MKTDTTSQIVSTKELLEQEGTHGFYVQCTEDLLIACKQLRLDIGAIARTALAERVMTTVGSWLTDTYVVCFDCGDTEARTLEDGRCTKCKGTDTFPRHTPVGTQEIIDAQRESAERNAAEKHN